jgi:surface protein
MELMFYKVGSALSTQNAVFDVSNWDTSNVTEMASMFESCTIESLDISNWDTNNVTDMGYMFAKSKIKTLKADGFCVPYTDYLFSGCKYLTEIDMTTWDTSKANSMVSMFEGCTSLTTVKGAGLDTSNVARYGMQNMFYNCTSLTYLDISNWTIVSNSYNMFYNCDNLTYDTVIKEGCSENSLYYLNNYLS